MACGHVTVSYIQKTISFTPSVFQTIIRIGFLLMLPGKFCLTCRTFCSCHYEFSPLSYSNVCRNTEEKTDVCRRTEEKTYMPTTWQIRFQLQNIIKGGNYTLQLAIAAATISKLKVSLTPIHFFHD